MASQPACPKDAEAMDAILRDMGVQDYEPRVINQLLDFAYRYATDVLADSRGVSEHAGKRQIDEDDVKFAITNRVENTISKPPPREIVMEQAKEKNSAPLPPLKQQFGLRLPPDRHCLLHPNYRLKSNRKNLGRNPQGLVVRTSFESQGGSGPSSGPLSGSGLYRASQGPSSGGSGSGFLSAGGFSGNSNKRPKVDDDYDA